jgi:hypothetical protein
MALVLSNKALDIRKYSASAYFKYIRHRHVILGQSNGYVYMNLIEVCIICNEASSKHPPLRKSAHDRHADQGVDASVAVAMTTATDPPLCVFS